MEGIDLPEEGEPGSNTPYAGPQSLSLDELEENSTGVSEASLLDTELQGDAVPEEFRGKKLTDVLGVIGNLKSALRISEETRQALAMSSQALTQTRSESAPVQTPSPAPQEQELTEAQWKELYESDPFQYQQKRFDYMQKQLARNVDARVAPATMSAVATAEAQARSSHKEAFEILGKEIDDFVKMAFPTPDARAALANPQAWERVVHYVQGANLDKVLAAKMAKTNQSDASRRQDAERNAAPPSFSSGTRQPAPPSRGGRLTPATMDETSKEIARNLMPELPPAKAYEEYCKNYL